MVSNGPKLFFKLSMCMKQFLIHKNMRRHFLYFSYAVLPAYLKSQNMRKQLKETSQQDVSKERNCSDLSHLWQNLDKNCEISKGVLFKPLLTPYSESLGKGGMDPRVWLHITTSWQRLQRGKLPGPPGINQHLVRKRGTPLCCFKVPQLVLMWARNPVLSLSFPPFCY